MDRLVSVVVKDPQMEYLIRFILVHRNLKLYSLSNESLLVLSNQSQMLEMKSDLNICY